MKNLAEDKKFKWSLKPSASLRDKSSETASPPGYNPSIHGGVVETEATNKNSEQTHLIIKKSWDVAIGPLKQIPMNLLLMYMSGSTISIFPIMMIGMMLMKPLSAITTTHTTFKTFEQSGTGTIGQKIVFVLGHIACVGLALYKCHSMGLLPSHASDWLAFAEPQIRTEYSGGGLVLL
ncbi:ER membrane protein complex subunit 4 [Bradysia coprophila]|uniref:ER membrane protein complex subunit 4 n=1 Tax=Bradysia coprophila TaxID=38358 RepID=UPI00187D9423|nr:ER membrane protein complex subunit 4 [Bradysia coprophila]